MKKIGILAMITAAVCLALTACGLFSPPSCSHQYEENIIAASTCSVPGTKVLTCKLCGSMEILALPLGEHDFSAFCGNAKMKKSTVRFIRSVDISRHGEEIRITVTGTGFLHGMVRIIVGTLIEVGRGTRTADSLGALFGAKRAEAGFMAPPEGLCLMEVFY